MFGPGAPGQAFSCRLPPSIRPSKNNVPFYLTIGHRLYSLRRFVLTDACNSQHDINETNDIGLQKRNNDESKPNLSSISILRLFGQCPKLQCVGDLRHWRIPSHEKKDICKKIAAIHGGHWLLNTFEP